MAYLIELKKGFNFLNTKTYFKVLQNRLMIMKGLIDLMPSYHLASIQEFDRSGGTVNGKKSAACDW